MQRACVLSFGAILSAWAAIGTAAPCAGFNDVDTNDPVMAGACPSIEWMKNRAITFGTSDTTYSPNAPVTRLQMAAFMYRLGFQNAFLRGGNAFDTTAVLGTTDNQPVDVRVNNTRVMRYEPHGSSANVIGGHPGNGVTDGAFGGFIGGGGLSIALCGFSNTAPCTNHVTDNYGTIGGGIGNRAGNSTGSTIDGVYATVGGGDSNEASGSWSTVSGGAGHFSIGLGSTVSGGESNAAIGNWSTVVGGIANTASGHYSVAMGRHAYVQGNGSFLFADASAESQVLSSTPNEFAVAATGGIALATSRTFANVCRLAPGGGSWSCTSDREVKRDFAQVDNGAVLAKVLSLPVSTWRFQTQPEAVRHMGPMAQDFREAFGLGIDDRTITQVDVNGVALAAIQGLNAKLEGKLAEKDARIEALERSNDELRRVVEALTARVAATLEGRVAAAPQ